MSRHVPWAVGGLALMAAVIFGRVTPPALAQDGPAVVRAVLFYSPTCPHCHQVITEDLPPLFEQYGEQLQILGVDVSTPGGQELYQAAIARFEIPPERQGVPTLIVGETVLVGSLEIAEALPGLIEFHLARGGVDLPDIPGLQETYERALAESAQEADDSPDATGGAEQEAASEAAPAPTTVALPDSPAPLGADAPRGTLIARLARDPLANLLSIGVLLGLGVSLGAVVAAGVWGVKAGDERPLKWLAGQSGRWTKVALAGVGLLIATTLVAQPADGPYAMPLAMGMATELAVVSVTLWASTSRNTLSAGTPSLPFGLIALTALVGLADAAYMAYVETTGAEAVCGAVGDCNAVQQSAYAILFGVVPVGVLGVVGNVAILAVLGASRVRSARLSDLAQVALLGLALFGTAFSTYLTFLEPFVIGASCAWCLTSAIAMMLLLWLIAPPGWSALFRLIRRWQQVQGVTLNE